MFLAISANIAEGRIYLITLMCVFFHEITHLIFLFISGCTGAVLNLYPGGIKLSADGFSALSYKKTALCCICAPLMNITAAALFCIAGRHLGIPLLNEISAINLIMGSANLLPLPFLDGGRTLNALFQMTHLGKKAEKCSDLLSIISLIVIFSVFFVLLLKGSYHFSLLCFFVYCTLGCICDKRTAVT